MAHFRGVLKGNRGETSRLGSKNSGIIVNLNSWTDSVSINLYHDHKDGKDKVVIIKTSTGKRIDLELK